MCLSLKYQEAKRQNQGGGKGEFHQNVLKNYDGYQAYNQEASGSFDS